MHRHAILPVLTVAMIGLYAAPAEAQFNVTFVSGTGSDASPDCSLTAPCRTFGNAHNKTAASGTILCRDSADFGPFTILKSITIDCAGTAAATQGLPVSQINIFGANIFV